MLNKKVQPVCEKDRALLWSHTRRLRRQPPKELNYNYNGALTMLFGVCPSKNKKDPDGEGWEKMEHLQIAL
jgi:hypothetical protein